MEEKNIELSIMEIISESGEAKSEVYEALELAKDGNYEMAEINIKKANEYINSAHNIHTTILSKGQEVVTPLLIHSQDHFMTTLSQIELIQEIIDLQKQINELKKLIK